MCARFTLTAEQKDILKSYPFQFTGEYQPDSNIAITESGFIITADEPDLIQRMGFGIIPYWAKSKRLEYDTWNIRSEEVMEKPTFAPLIENHKTCLVIADGFYEFEGLPDGRRQPWRFIVNNRKTFVMAGLWSEWVDPETNEAFRTFGIMTTVANKMVARIHKKKRMPVILPLKFEKRWLNKKLSSEELLKLCTTLPDASMSCFKVSPKVNKVSTKKMPNKGIDLAKPYNTDDEPMQGKLDL
ncbi:putative SOS response-associated peptidase YedK [Pedobacter sp. CG_S7]|uniref:SOS response-associated peptidase n=1 Tax=Pedobacter sp. CG_S7 TaxID=3143930 RepID=UPI003398BC1F